MSHHSRIRILRSAAFKLRIHGQRLGRNVCGFRGTIHVTGWSDPRPRTTGCPNATTGLTDRAFAYTAQNYRVAIGQSKERDGAMVPVEQQGRSAAMLASRS
ncbi:MAG: hypothetical protein ACRD8A_14805 [Candidatus Acidiferrales bacterium]